MILDRKKLDEAIIKLLEANGAASSEAGLVAESLIAAEARGIKTHGLKFLPIAIDRIEKGLINIPTDLEVLNDEGAITHFDGGNGLGQFAAAKSMEKSIEKASQLGIGLSLTRNSNHVGFLSFYTLMVADKGMIGICMSNSAPAMAPWGGVEPFFGTNPISISAPAVGSPHITLDMSTSIVARGKIRMAESKGEKILPGWAIDSKGNRTEDPGEALKGSILPIGGPKGYGMALFIDIICGLLSGSKYGKGVKTFHKPLAPTGIGFLTAAIDISRFMETGRFAGLLKDYIKDIKSSKKAVGNDVIYMPGEIETRRGMNDQQIDADDGIIEKINVLLDKKGIKKL